MLRVHVLLEFIGIYKLAKKLFRAYGGRQTGFSFLSLSENKILRLTPIISRHIAQ